MKRTIIGIGHKARQGKDTIADYLNRKYGCRTIHFADALYDECRNATILFVPGDGTAEESPVLYLKTSDEEYFRFEDPDETIINWIKEKGKPEKNLPYNALLLYDGMTEKDGTLLQFWGTEFRRKRFSWNYWTDIVRKTIDENPGTDFIIPDTRFKNEAQMISEMGGLVWKMERTGFIANDRDPNHTSEVDLDGWKFDITIVNDSTIEALCEKTDHIFRKLKGLPDGFVTNQQG